MKLTQLPDSFTTEDWIHFFVSMCQEKKLLLTAFPSTGFIDRAIRRLESEYYDKYLIAEILSSVLDSDYRKSVGVSPRLLSAGVFDREVYSYPDDYPWQYQFFEKCCGTEEEHRYFRQWIGVYLDGHFAASNTPPMIGQTEYGSWGSIQKKAIQKLDKGVNTLIQRFMNIGSYVYATS